MTDYSVSINGREYEVKISDQGVTINKQNLRNQLIPINDSGLHLLKQGDKKYEIHLYSTNGEEFIISMGGNRLIAQVSSGYHNKMRKLRKEDNPKSSLRSVMPGVVVDVLVKVGDTVTAGQPLVILESMKMQMFLKSAVNGKVTSIRVKPGEQVHKDQLLIDLG